ncbi:MAG: hypothetical protein JWQ71_957, partial [Pedosphaera sp.]|nr:hypothetical protein [Pedosphaera sp.]
MGACSSGVFESLPITSEKLTRHKAKPIYCFGELVAAPLWRIRAFSVM